MVLTRKVCLIGGGPILGIVKLLAKLVVSIFVRCEYGWRVSRAKRGLIKHVNETIDGWRARNRRLARRLLFCTRGDLIAIYGSWIGRYRAAENGRWMNASFVVRRIIILIGLIIVRWRIWIVKAWRYERKKQLLIEVMSYYNCSRSVDF